MQNFFESWGILRHVSESYSRRGLLFLAGGVGGGTLGARGANAETTTPRARDVAPRVFATRIAAAAAQIAPAAAVLQTLGYSREGDRGGQTYVRDDHASIGAFQSADGAWWKPSAHPLRPEQFGARGNGAGDDSAAINAMIRLAASWQQTGKNGAPPATTMILSGSYRIAAPIELWNEHAGAISFGTFRLEGEAPSYVRGRPPEIIATFYDRPIIAMQGMRMTVLSNFTCRREIGIPLPAPGDLMNDTGGDGDHPWWNPHGVLVDKRYSMSAGVSIDPLSDSLPADGGYGGGEPYYSKSAGAVCKSSVISFEGVNIYDNIVGVAIGCAADSSLADSITFERCLLGQNKVAIAIGTDQARDCCVRNCHILGVRTMLDGSSYGRQIGVMPTVIGGVLDICKWLLNFGSGAGCGDGVMVGTYSESLWSLGLWAGPYSLTLTACKLKFLLGEESGCARVAHFIGQNLVLFGGSWSFYRGEPHKCFIANTGNIRIDGAQFDDQPVFADPLSVDITRMPLHYMHGGPNFGVAMNHTLLAGNATGAGAGGCIMPAGGAVLFPGRRSSMRFQNFEGPIETLVEVATIEKTGRGKAEFKTADRGAYRVGDYLCQDGQRHNTALPGEWKFSGFGNWAQYLGRVSAIDGSTVSLGDVLDDFPGGPTQIYFGPGLGAFHSRSTGVTQAGSDRISDVSNIVTWAVGQRIRIFDETHPYNEAGPAGAYIVEIDQSAKAMVLSRQVSKTIQVALLCDAVTAMTGRLLREEGAPTSGVHWAGDAFAIDGIGGELESGPIITGYICTKSGSPGQWKPTSLN